ncbi:hypothetical protein GCM10010124_09150 [Pilimelia terevasa]|uniref:Phage shock protein PspC N-terminal domain-containing protein n=1 Tax=Pilimelia terevasa TaxID=53372 RepID=A0A8J3FGW0_9ACTN|nr:PspC domain-containing protein [Pilimelia terevasa]GGK18715.1 hypothetical protein GCM10010124_09150 [Pilimelia terevasa]
MDENPADRPSPPPPPGTPRTAPPPADDSPAPPDGSQVPPDGSQMPPDGSQVPPEGSQVPPPGAAYGGPTRPGPLFRHGLVRPVQGRYLAGVCAGIARTTRTDPVLWRVLLAVLGLFGVGIAVYLVLWLVSPAEGDTGSPVDALIDRGESSTPAGVTVAVAVGAFIAVGVTMGNGGGALVLGVAVVLGIALLANRGTGRTGLSRLGFAPGTAPSFFGPVRAAAAAPAPAGPVWSAAPPAYAPPAPAAGYPSPPAPPYGPPFAPHGPWGGPPAPPAPAPPAPPKPRRERSALGLITFSLMLLALAGVGVADLTGAGRITGGTYVATALGVVGLGLLVGTWFGRARLLIPLGLLLSVALGGIAGASHVEPEPVTWTPQSVATLSPRYEHRFGDATLDLRQINFAGRQTPVEATVKFGVMRILVPTTVILRTTSQVQAGRISILGDVQQGDWDSAPADQTYPATTGPGTGTLHLTLTARAGNLEVVR